MTTRQDLTLVRDRAGYQAWRSRRAGWPVTGTRLPHDRLIAAFEDHPGPRPQLIDDIITELHAYARQLQTMGAAGRYGAFIDLYMHRPAIFLRDRHPERPPHPALTAKLPGSTG